jgi:hypothetical protein
MSNGLKLKGRRALVTGGTKGVGKTVVANTHIVMTEHGWVDLKCKSSTECALALTRWPSRNSAMNFVALRRQ